LEPVSREVLIDAAAWRARHGLRTPDAILLATGMRSGTTATVTNDDRWRVSASEGIETILLAQLSR
jgi:predicted nucleic acid-binding protein